MVTLLAKPETLKIPKQFTFMVETPAWYCVTVSCKVKSEKQRGRNETDDEELVLQLDDLSFPKPQTSRDFKDAPAAFSGGTQHHQEKTVKIILVLNQGEHTLLLTPQYQAEVTRVDFEAVTVTNNRMELQINQVASSRKQQPWITLVLVGASFTKCSLKAKVWWHFLNGDDIQLRINGEIVLNETNTRRHKNWVFHAQPLVDVFGREQTVTKDLPQISFNEPMTYLELWVDQTPFLQEVIIEGTDLESDIIVPAIQKYSSGPNNEDFNRYDAVIFNVVKEVNQLFSNQESPPPSVLDPSLVKAMMYVESKIGWHKSPPGSYSASPDVMQIADPRNPAIHTLNNDGWVDPITGQVAQEYMWTSEGVKIMDFQGCAKVESVKDSVYWALIWLYHKAEIIGNSGERSWRSWFITIERYNGGGDPKYRDKVYDIYQKGNWH